MSVNQVNKNNATKDGRTWYFYVRVPMIDGKTKAYKSKKYATKTEAIKAERDFLSKIDRKEINITNMTFSELYDEFYNYKKDKVKSTTLRTYKERREKFYMLEKIKVQDFNVNHYIKWRNYIGSLDIKIKTKNHYHKFLKEILNYGIKWHDLNFAPIYSKMEKFTDPNAAPEEMDFYTFDEFKKFLSYENDIKWKALFETLYYCGLRRGELRGLTWDNINFEDKTLSVVKNVVNENGDSGYWKITTPKTRTSTRTIPMPDILINDLKKL